MPKPYPFISQIFGNGAMYSFITRNNVKLVVYFTDVVNIIDILDDFQVISNAMFLSIELVEKGRDKLPFDPNVGVTIAAIIKGYYGYYGNNLIIAYHCDERDGRQTLRFEKFKRWFDRYSKNTGLTRYDKLILVEEGIQNTTEVYITFLFSENHIHISNIKKELARLEKKWAVK